MEKSTGETLICKYAIRGSNAPTLSYGCCFCSQFNCVVDMTDNCVKINSTTKLRTQNRNKYTIQLQ